MKKYKSEAFEAIHESMSDLHKVGGISDERMREYAEMCLTKPAATVPRVSTQKKPAAPLRSGAPVYAQGK